jgi:hypothetical protein
VFFLAEGELLFSHTPRKTLTKAEAEAEADAAAVRTAGPEPLDVPPRAAGFDIIQVRATCCTGFLRLRFNSLDVATRGYRAQWRGTRSSGLALRRLSVRTTIPKPLLT